MIVLIAVLIIALAIGALLYIKKKQHDALVALAAKLGWTELTDTALLYAYLPMSLAGEGIRNYLTPAYSLELGSVEAVIFGYAYITESTSVDADGQTQRTEEDHHFTVLSFPDIKAGSGVIHMHHRGLLNREFAFNGYQRLGLEGDFNKYFDVFVPEGQQTDALEVLEPDVMATVIDMGKGYDFDLANGRISIIGDGNLLTENRACALLAYAEKLLEQID